MTSELSKIPFGIINQMASISGDAMVFTWTNINDMIRVSDTFCGGDISEAVRLCLEEGLAHLLIMCDMDDKINSEGHL